MNDEMIAYLEVGRLVWILLGVIGAIVTVRLAIAASARAVARRDRHLIDHLPTRREQSGDETSAKPSSTAPPDPD